MSMEYEYNLANEEEMWDEITTTEPPVSQFERGQHVRSSNWEGVGLWFVETTGRDQAVVVMIGDDYHHTVDLDSLTPLEEEDFCGGCGQIGCGAYGV